MRAIVLTLVLTMVGCASTPDGKRIDRAQIADGVSTAAGLALVDGAVEANPLGLALIPAKAAAGKVVETYVEDCRKRQQWVRGINAPTYGAVANNVAVILGLSSAPLIGVLTAAYYFFNFEPRECANEQPNDASPPTGDAAAAE